MKKNKILILGNGFIGKRLQESFKCALSKARINSFYDAEREINKYKPSIIINCIGSTGRRNVDDCELDKDATLFANTFVPIMLAEACLRNGIKLVHVSSGCIYHFDYNKGRPIRENNIPDFFGLFYSRSKIYTERALNVLADKCAVLIVRIRIPLDNRLHPRNILSKLITYKEIIDIPNSITYIPDFIAALRHLIRINASGIYNVVNKGGLRYPRLLNIYKGHKPDFKYKIINYRKLKLVRTNLILSTAKLEKTGFKTRHINEVLKECVEQCISC
ncbi:MAG: sugar nucleotide-binding protein [Candidatus Omnitrophica bacterium]|jgi:dTDP-4-dehydrorhamnose reductase|nr:sugar nucleotide-binding protein [Candidatus Omnitrophota bacterium]